ncbi:MAG: hypothetical protein A2V70_05165 [Planctomycetes bacterium RBG_13_63_9]|nr:MAG: hypothetical protein A2V70_05165 [Planctomycetes bacterium RBG_13_63_9]
MLLVVLVFLLPGCRSKAPEGTKLLLYCGAGIRPPVAELAAEYGRLHKVTVECDYAGSEVLLSRIKLSCQGDLYMPGDVHYVELAEEQELVSSKKNVCYFVPVILVQKGNPKNIRTLEDLTRPELAVGLGDPEACAIGRKCSKIFEKNGIVEEEMDVAFRSLTVNELGNHIKLGMLDAVIVWDAVAALYGDVGEVVRIPPDQNIISTVAVGVLRSSEHPELAGEFVEFITSDRGKEVFAKHDYSTTLPE